MIEFFKGDKVLMMASILIAVSMGSVIAHWRHQPKVDELNRRIAAKKLQLDNLEPNKKAAPPSKE